MSETNRLDALFVDRSRKRLIAYLTVGDPHVDESAALALAAARAGADVIELGVPFSDPSADGPVIERAMLRALTSGGMRPGTVARALDVARRVRAESQVPLVLFGYFNPLLQFGLAKLSDEAARAGVDGLLVVDLSAEESSPFEAELTRTGLRRIILIAPTTPLARARSLSKGAGGFAYYVAVTGTSGAGHLDANEVEARVTSLRSAVGSLPIAVGFGIRDAASVKRIAAFADAVVVGTALVERIAGADTADARVRAVEEFIGNLKSAL